MHSDDGFDLFAPEDPRRDEQLAALLRRSVGDVPVGAVDWEVLAARITSALPSRTSLAWWSYTDRWSRRIIPLAIAASLVGIVTLWNADDASAVVVAQSAPEVVADVVEGAPMEDAARSFARFITADASLIVVEPE